MINPVVRVLILVVFLSVACCLRRSVVAQQTTATANVGSTDVENQILKVGTKQSPPFAIKNPDGSWTGISIELWDHLTGEEFTNRIDVLPVLFNVQEYAIALRPGSNLRKPLNEELLRYRESDSWDELIYRYLGRIE